MSEHRRTAAKSAQEGEHLGEQRLSVRGLKLARWDHPPTPEEFKQPSRAESIPKESKNKQILLCKHSSSLVRKEICLTMKLGINLSNYRFSDMGKLQRGKLQS